MERSIFREADEAARRLAAVVDATSEAIVALDPDGTIAAWNRGAEDVYGYSAQEVLGRHFSMLDSDGGGDVDRLIARAAAGAATRDHEAVRRRKDGTLVDIATTYTPIRDADGEVTAISVVARDVSEIRESQRRAEKAAQDLATVVNSASEAIYKIDTDGMATFANAAAGRLFGTDPRQVLGKSMHDAHHHTRPDGTPYPAHECPVVTAVPHGRPLRLEAELFFRADGTPFYADVAVTPALEGGEVVGAVVLFTDVTERIRAEQAAREAMARFESAFRDAPIGMALVDLEHPDGPRYSQVNDALCKMLGYSADELTAHKLETLTHPDDVAADVASFQAVLRGGDFGGPIRKRYIARDGSIVWALRTASVVRNAETSHIIIQIQDITDQLRAEDELRASEARYRSLVEAANEGVWAIDAGGRTTFINAAMEEIIGLPAADVIGQPPREFVGDSAVVKRAIGELVEGRASRMEGVIRRPDGTTVPVLISAAPFIDGDGRYAGALAMVVDLRERLRAEEQNQRLQEQLHQAQKLETVGQLAGGVAHDFNNLLAVIMNYADFAQEAVGDHPAASDIAEINRAAERATELTQQLLLFARKGVVKKERLDVNEVICSFDRLLQRAVGPQVVVDLDLADAVPRVLLNRGQLEQVLLNLAVNAGDAMPDGGTLRIATSMEAVPGQTGNGSPSRMVRVTVSDTGVGMPAEVRERVFDPFFTTKPEGSGTGLGLATVYGMVSDAGGSIRIDSAPGAGTTLTMDFPAAPPRAVLSQSDELALGDQKVILVAEDEPVVRRLTSRILTDAGYRVLEAASGNDALRVMHDHDGSVDAIITDVVMPEQSGTALAERVRELWPHVQVLFMSGYTDRPHRVPAGARVVAKPFVGAQLLSELALLIEEGSGS